MPLKNIRHYFIPPGPEDLVYEFFVFFGNHGKKALVFRM